MRDDLKAAFRSLRSAKGFTTAAVILLTLGVGATTAIFSVVDAVVLRGLPFDEHDRLVAVGERPQPLGDVGRADRDPDALAAVAPQNYVDWAAEQQVFESMAAVASGWLTLHERGTEPESLVPQRVTAGFFTTLRVRPAIGRPFSADDEVEGRDRVAILSDGLWRRRFGADPRIIGRRIALENLEGGPAASSAGYDVVGVMPAEFAYPVGATRPTDVWVPYVVPPGQRTRNPAQFSRYLQVIARLKPGVSLAQSQSQMDQIAVALERANPVWNKDSGIRVRPLVDHIVGARIRSWMLLLLGAVGVVLLIACANVANLLLARASARGHELGVRAALGASRWRLVRQLMTESFLLSIAGAACAVVVAWWAVRVLRVSMPDGVPRVTTIAIDPRVLLAAAGLSLLTAILFGIFPALQLSKPDLTTALKQAGRSNAGSPSERLRNTLVIAELALAVILLVGAALFTGSFVSLLRIDPGFNPAHVLTAQISPRLELGRQPADFGPALADVVDRVGRIRGVIQASMSDGVPFSGGITTTSITIPGTANSGPGAGAFVTIRQVTPGYHQALGIPILKGRAFNSTDRKGRPDVAIISASAARQYFPGTDPIGRVAGIYGNRTIVGVAGDVHQFNIETNPIAEAYVPMAQGRVTGGILAVRTNGRPYDVLSEVKAAVFGALPEVPLRNVASMDEVFERRIAQRKVTMLLLGLFGILGLTIAVVGVYGVMSYLVAQRTHEIGVRMALGATASDVVGMVVGNGCMLLAAGLAIGGLAAWYLSAAAGAFLFQITPTDPRAFAAAILSLTLAALAATAVPARRAARVDPMVALRNE